MEGRFSKREISEVVRRVLTYYMRKKEERVNENKDLFLIPSYPIGLEETIREYELYEGPGSVDFLMEDVAAEIFKDWDISLYNASDKKDIASILSRLAVYEKLEIYDPSLEFLRELRNGKESKLFIKIVIFFLMSEKPVIVRLPYNMNFVSKGAFGKELHDLRNDLWDMGITFSDQKVNFMATMKLDFVTEEIVEQCYKRGEKIIYAEKDAIVTPLAWEKGKELNINIIKG